MRKLLSISRVFSASCPCAPPGPPAVHQADRVRVVEEVALALLCRAFALPRPPRLGAVTDRSADRVDGPGAPRLGRPVGPRRGPLRLRRLAGGRGRGRGRRVNSRGLRTLGALGGAPAGRPRPPQDVPVLLRLLPLPLALLPLLLVVAHVGLPADVALLRAFRVQLGAAVYPVGARPGPGPGPGLATDRPCVRRPAATPRHDRILVPRAGLQVGTEAAAVEPVRRLLLLVLHEAPHDDLLAVLLLLMMLLLMLHLWLLLLLLLQLEVHVLDVRVGPELALLMYVVLLCTGPGAGPCAGPDSAALGDEAEYLGATLS
ncbi:Pathogenesis-related homeodomain protein [Frankliniella fusca]|uniref:Pathogenesis-related homeodomain protein n=1 Tax=Frankliniella fusca TaxID=407009 RepID=A0AAE1HZH5_9NEOP|nr:Pathogenesis-related homeodomain protein [Frankliniella fusca]